MKIQILRNVLVEVEKRRLEEVWDKEFRKWEVLSVEDIIYNGDKANIYLPNGDVIVELPKDAFEKIDE